jgi:TPP-dependent pyruvate/acetoin dehydrogenase alpha subunit
MLDSTFYRSLYRIRRVEEEIARVYPSDTVMSPVHLSIGQEAISVAICEALQPDDIVFGTYRGHALYLAKGGDLPGMVAELYGRATGVAKGKAGSMHLIDTSAGVMGASAVVATSIPQAVGYALANKMQRKPQIVAVFFGDGAVEEGVFHESLNFAALKRLPILFVCENNEYAIHSRRRDRQAAEQILGYARAHGLAAERFAQMDIYELYARTCCVAEELRTGRSGPVFFECSCYRWMEHVGPSRDFDADYRNPDEAEIWIRNDQLHVVGERLDPGLRTQLEQDVEEEIHAAFEFAEQSAFPRPPELYTDLYG